MSKKVKASLNKAKDTETKPTPPIVAPPGRQPDNRRALDFLDFCVSQAPLSRQQHIQAQQSLQQLSGAIGRLDAFMLTDKMDKEDELKKKQ